MELSPIIVYFVMQADKISKGFGVMGLLMLAIMIVIALHTVVEGPGKTESAALMKKARMFMYAALAFGCLFIITPQSKTVAAMYILPAVVNNSQVQELPADVLAFIRGILRKYTPQAGDFKVTLDGKVGL